jgi:hypothetical protein
MKEEAEGSKVLLQYDVVDGPIRETHRWVIPEDTTVADIIEHVENSPYIDRESVRIFGVSETDEF